MSHHLDSVPFSGIIRIRDMMYTVERPFRLDQGDVSFDAPDAVKAAMAKAIADNRSHYLQTAGVPRLQELLAEKLRRKNAIPVGSPDEVLVTNGGIHGLFILFQALLNPGDEVIIPDPQWPPAAGTILSARGVVVRCPLHESMGWRLDVDELAARDHAEDARHLPELAAEPDGRRADAAGPRGDRGAGRSEHGLWVVSDEAYEDVVFGVEHVSIASLAGHVPAHHPGLHVQQVVRDDRPPAGLHGRRRRGACATGCARLSSSRRATSRRSCSTAGSARSRRRRMSSNGIGVELEVRRDLFYSGVGSARRRLRREAAERRVLRVPEVRSRTGGRRATARRRPAGRVAVVGVDGVPDLGGPDRLRAWRRLRPGRRGLRAILLRARARRTRRARWSRCAGCFRRAEAPRDTCLPCAAANARVFRRPRAGPRR